MSHRLHPPSAALRRATHLVVHEMFPSPKLYGGTATMNDLRRSVLWIGLGAMLCMLTACIMPAIDAGHEGVLVKKPVFFGHGGVDPVPATTGRVAVAPTTEVIDVDVRP